MSTHLPGPAMGDILAPSAMEQIDAWLDRHGEKVDIVLGLVALLLLGVSGISLMSGYDGTLTTAATVAASLGIPTALAFRRRWPVASAVVVNALALAHFAFGQTLLPVDMLIYFSVYTTTVHAPRWAGRLSLGSALLGSALVAGTMLGSNGVSASWAISTVFVFVGVSAPAVVAWALGLLRIGTRQRRAAQRERTRRLATERNQQAVIAVAAERARIAREMHDVVAHSLSIVVAQADGGRYVAAADPAAAAQVLETISVTGRSALRDMRRILGVLREGDDSPTAPQPGAADIDSLVERVRASGMQVQLVRSGAPQDLPAGMGLAVYRICQEALTNVMKHAGPVPGISVRVDLAFHPGALVVQIDDDGRGAGTPGDGAGQGLVGMRERVSLFGGTLWAGPRSGGGYRVNAAFPLPTA